MSDCQLCHQQVGDKTFLMPWGDESVCGGCHQPPYERIFARLWQDFPANPLIAYQYRLAALHDWIAAGFLPKIVVQHLGSALHDGYVSEQATRRLDQVIGHSAAERFQNWCQLTQFPTIASESLSRFKELFRGNNLEAAIRQSVTINETGILWLAVATRGKRRVDTELWEFRQQLVKFLPETELERRAFDFHGWVTYLGIRAIQLGDESEQMLGKSLILKWHHRLVPWQLNRMRIPRWVDEALEEDDLIIEGELGLLKAAEKFDLNHFHTFSTYAQHWIRQAMTRAFSNQARLIRLPENIEQQLGKIEGLLEEFGLMNSREEIQVQFLSQKLGLSIKQAERLILASQMKNAKISLDSYVQGTEDLTVEDTIRDPEFDHFSSLDFHRVQILGQTVRNSLETAELPERTLDLIRRYFGFSQPRQTLDRIGRAHNISRQRVWQVLEKALNQLALEPVWQMLGREFCNLPKERIKTYVDEMEKQRAHAIRKTLATEEAIAYAEVDSKEE